MRSSFLVLVLAALLGLAACTPSEERAEAYYQSALALLEEGDVDRAIVELRNVFTHDERHLEARRLIAELLLNERGNRQGAYNQYLLLAEQHPDDLDARIALTRLAIGVGQWEEVDRHGARALAIDADNPEVRPLALAMNYRAAVLSEDQTGLGAVIDETTRLLETRPDDTVLRAIRIDAHVNAGRYTSALTDIEWLLTQDPENLLYWQQRLELLAILQDWDGMRSHLIDAVAQFPDNEESKAQLLRFYMSRDEVDAAEAFLRAEAERTDSTAVRIDLVRFLNTVRGPEVAQVEIDLGIQDSDDPDLFRVIGAGLSFEAGDTVAAIATVQDVLSRTDPGTTRNEYLVLLARMLEDTGEDDDARTRVAEVLENNPSQVEALKIQARWLIEDDAAEDAISALRVALSAAPEDTQALSLLAVAYERIGQPDLYRDTLALAVQASGNAPGPALTYAAVLVEDERLRSAEDVLIGALRLQPANITLLSELGQIYLLTEDLPRLEGVINALRQIDTPEAELTANGLEAERISRTRGPDQAMVYLEELAQAAGTDSAAQIALVRARLLTGETDAALALARSLGTDNADNPVFQFVLAAVETAAGNFGEAAPIYRGLVDEEPRRVQVWMQLATLEQLRGDPTAAAATIAEALERNPGNPELLWATASFLERNGDIEGAITIYEELYARDSASVVVANNLASLLSAYRDDAESLERAWNIARRFKDVEIAPLQDTYGWILHRRGESQQALPYLEAAASVLTEDPIVQFHLGQIHDALGQVEAARAAYQRALAIAGPVDPRAQFETARTRLTALETAPETQPAETTGD